MSIEVMKQAHEALGTADEFGFWELQKTAIAALRAAIKAAEKQEGWVLREVLFDKGEPIAQREPAQQEPLGSVVIRDGLATLVRNRDIKSTDQRLYTTPPAAQRQWVGLTDEELHKLWRESPFRGSGGQMDWFTEGARVAEAKLREKNTGETK